jgi:hypothetical protein
LPKIKEEIAALIRKNGTHVRVIEEAVDINELPGFSAKEPNTSRKDFSSLRKKYEIDKLVIISVQGLGFIRNYSSYVAIGDPFGAIDSIGYMVDLNNNKYEWYQRVFITKGAAGEWDEPPQFSSLTNAYILAIEENKDEFLKPFGRLIPAEPNQ